MITERFYMNRFCDLHVHSTFSDGTDTPTKLIELAQKAGLQALALTDHNTVAGLPEFLHAAQGKDVQAIAGTEFSTDYKGTELHILTLFLKPEDFEKVTDVTKDYHQKKEQSNRDLVQRLSQAGFAIDYEAIKRSTPKGQVNRALIAAELTRCGYTESVKDAFSRLLKAKHGYYVPPVLPTPFEIITFIKALGAVAVLAHPFLNLNEEQLRAFLQEAVPCGLDAMETMYATYDEQTTAKAMEIAEEFGLLHSGGSDYHGENKPHIQIGTGQGNLSIPVAWMNAMERRIKECEKK